MFGGSAVSPEVAGGHEVAVDRSATACRSPAPAPLAKVGAPEEQQPQAWWCAKYEPGEEARSDRTDALPIRQGQGPVLYIFTHGPDDVDIRKAVLSAASPSSTEKEDLHHTEQA